MAGRPKGQPKTGGRKPGVRNKASREREAKIAAEGITPLDVMLTAMRQHYQAGDFTQAATIAKDAAPYVHPRLSAVTMEATVRNDASELSDAELAAVIGQSAGRGSDAAEAQSGADKPSRVH